MNANKSVTYISISQLHFDSLNPRLPENMHSADEATVLDWMIRHENIDSLMESIATTDYSDAEPVLVVKIENGNFAVIEGNRRLAAVKLLNDPSKAKVKVKTIKPYRNG